MPKRISIELHGCWPCSECQHSPRRYRVEYPGWIMDTHATGPDTLREHFRNMGYSEAGSFIITSLDEPLRYQ